MSTLLNLNSKIKVTFTPKFDFERFVLLVDSEESGTSNSDQFEITGAEVSTGSEFPVTFAPESDPFNTTDVMVNVSDPTITFPTAGKYFVQIGKPFNRIRFNNGGDALKVVSAPLQYGSIEWSSMNGSFYGTLNMNNTPATDVPNLSNVSDFTNALRNSTFNAPINDWDMSNATDIRQMFWDNAVFNQPINDWDVSNVEDDGVRNLFRNATSFNQPLNKWNLAKVKDLRRMFLNATSFNQPLNDWDTSGFEDLVEMFEEASSFNQPLDNWDTSNVNIMFRMFDSSAFNQNISAWDVSNVENFDRMFSDTPFNQNLSAWDISSAQTISRMFRRAGMSCENYTDTLVSWINKAKDNNQPINLDATDQNDQVFATARSGGANFADAGEARTNATTPVGDGGLGWTISDDIVQTNC